MYDDEVVNKCADETINVYIEFTNWLNTGSTISTLTSVVTDGDETISGEAISGTKIVFTIAGGSKGNSLITCTIVTSDSETLIAKVKLRIR